MVMHDSFGWRCVEIPVAIGGIAIATADNVLNVMSLGGKGALEGGAKELLKVGGEELGKEGEKVGANLVKDEAKADAKAAKWKAGDDPHAPTRSGNAPSDTTVRRREWQNEANNPTRNDYTQEDLERMREGKPPQRYNPAKGGTESMERSHEPVPKREGGTETVPRWPQEHATVDPHRHPGY
jgi:hypothetical protein